MTIEEIQAKHDELDRQIQKLITNFQNETKLGIEEIRIQGKDQNMENVVIRTVFRI